MSRSFEGYIIINSILIDFLMPEMVLEQELKNSDILNLPHIHCCRYKDNIA